MTSLKSINVDQAVKLRRSGLPWCDVAEKCDSTIYLLLRALSKAGIARDNLYNSPKRKIDKVLSDCELNRMKRLKEAGATWKELGRITGIDWGKLKRYVERN